MKYKFELNEDYFKVLNTALTVAEIYFSEVTKSSKDADDIMVLKKLIWNQLWNGVSVKKEEGEQE